MDCTTFRERIGADPAECDERAAAHERQCPACAAYARRVRAAENLIAQALRFDVSALRRAESRPASAKRRRRDWATATVAVAAAAIAAMAVWLGVSITPSDDPVVLAAEVLDHWRHEPYSWVRSDTPVGENVLAAVLAEHASIDRVGMSVITYARSCLINGHWVPHLVVQGEAGPVMVLLLSREILAETMPLDLAAEGLRGLILPLGEGSVAILGDDAEDLQSVQEDIAGAVEWTI
ncbi:MAG TPA: DUF3379 family protein [Gammaproteobacteria bacterium]|jgi:hypothetical protein